MTLAQQNNKASTAIKVASIEEALEIAGHGWYTYFVVLAGGINIMASYWTIIHCSIVVPATDCDLKLTVQQKAVLSTMVFSGMILTTHLFGFLSDEHGRRLTAMLCNLVCGFLNILAALAPGYASLSVIIFLSGVVNAGIIMPSYIFVGECVPMKFRSLSMNLAGAAGALSYSLLPALALVLIPLDFQWDLLGLLKFTSWRLVVLISVLPAFLGAFSLYFLKESPKFLWAKGKKEEAFEVLNYMYAVNNRSSKQQFHIESVITNYDEIVDVSQEKRGAVCRLWKQTTILFKKPLLRITLALCVLQAGVVGACNAIYLTLPQTAMQMINFLNANQNASASVCQILNSENTNSFNSSSIAIDDKTPLNDEVCKNQVPVDTYYVSLVVGSLQLIFYCINGKMTQWFGSKPLLVVYLVISIGCALILEFVTNIWASIAIQGVIALALITGVPITYILNVEYFPTKVRSTAGCLCTLSGRIFSTGATVLMGALQDGYCETSYYVFAAFVVGICVVAILLPPAPDENEEKSKA